MTGNLATLTCRIGRVTVTLQLTDTHLIEKWRKGSESGENRWSLENLSPEPGFASGRTRDFSISLYVGVGLLAIVLIAHFSIIKDMFPLIAPVFAILGILALIKAVKNLKIEKWTIFLKEDGGTAAYVIHSGCNPQEREKFERTLTDHVIMIKRSAKD